MNRATIGISITVAFLFVGTGCKSVLGIHDSTSDGHRDAASPADGIVSADVGADLDGRQSAADLSVAETDALTADGGGDTSTADASSAARDGSSADAATADVSVSQPDGTSADAGSDAAGDRPMSDGPSTDGTSVSDARMQDASQDATTVGGVCAAPWHAEGAPARLYSNPTGTMTACSFVVATLPPLSAALNQTDFRAAAACGTCLRVRIGTASVVVQVVDRSGVDGILLSPDAMNAIAPGASLTTVDWSSVPCDTQGAPISYFIKDGSNAGYVGIQVRNARYAVASLAVLGSGGKATALTLQSYNFWESTTAGAGPLTLRLTDINGQVVEHSGIRVVPQTESVGQSQLPLCM